jgi:hypothetical protein
MITKKTVDRIEEYFKDLSIPSCNVELSPCETIVDLNKFISFNLSLLKAKYDSLFIVPYYDRVIKLIKILKSMNYEKEGTA